MTKRVIFSVAVLAVFAAVFIQSCTKDKGRIFTEPPPPPPGACDTVTYNRHIKAILDTKCNMDGCHPANATLGDYNQVTEKAAKIKDRALDRPPGSPGAMPPSGMPPLTDQQRQLLKCWLENGNKEN